MKNDGLNYQWGIEEDFYYREFNEFEDMNYMDTSIDKEFLQHKENDAVEDINLPT